MLRFKTLILSYRSLDKKLRTLLKINDFECAKQHGSNSI